jgi:hypothetical protein
MGDSAPLIIQVVGPLAGVDTALVDLLAPLFITPCRVFTNNGGRVASHVIHQGLFHVAYGRFWFPAGAVPRIAAWLQGHGHEVQIMDQTPPRQGVDIDQTALAKLPHDQADFVRAVVENRRGLVEVPNASLSIPLIASAARALPQARITIATASRSLARQVCRQLRRRLGEPVLLLARGGVVLSDARLKVCTRSGVDEGSTDIVFYFQATDAITAWYLGERRRDEDERDAAFQARLRARLQGQPTTLPSIHPARSLEITYQHVYGFVSQGQRLGRRERLVLEAQVGTVMHRVAGPAGPPAEVQVLLAEAPLVMVAASADGLDRKRRAIWQADRRNDVIAEIADGFVCRDVEALWRHGLLLDGHDHGMGAGSRPLRVAVLVESPEHGRQLVGRLPRWPLLAGQRSHGERDDRLPPQLIITHVNARGLARLGVDVLIRVDGSNGPLDLPGFPPRARERQGRPVVLVDLGDDGDAIATAATRRRLEDYLARGWDVTAPDRWFHEPELEPGRRRSKSSRGTKAREDGR